MSNIFQDALTDATGLEERLIGPTYPYWKNIKNPGQLGMSSNGNAIGSNISGLVAYAEVMATGNSAASTTGGPLGNKFFLKTAGKCKDVSTGNQVDRYIYINNIPNGSIPFISSGLGTNFSDAKGLIPGTMGNLSALNPFTILGSFMEGSLPDCQEITMETVDTNNSTGQQTEFVTTVDISNMNSCNWGKGRKNPVTGQTCTESFENLNVSPAYVNLPKNKFTQLYFVMIGLLFIYILYCIMEKGLKNAV